MRVFITGIGSGLGEALAKLYLEAGEEVYAVSRLLPKSLEGFANLHFLPLNLHAHERIEGVMRDLVGDKELDIAVLNAGILGELKDMSETSLSEIGSIMDLNVWANKVILDYFKLHPPKQIVAISSGAAVSGARGWNAYALSKAALNMLIKLYAAEMPYTHLSALAPGLVETPMMKHILSHADPVKFPVVKRLMESKRLDPKDAAILLADTFAKLLEYPSGEYLDIRELQE
ncbi:MAG: alcohol dehydrogenase [Epsilonproteobacteria bacterium]|nr:alcohol dehydrogenase [Campylobacterota bacterium]NPA63977.1 SDR family NAD(P)-dependent oxidoreductase [Campylobacterota bacterium]